MDPSPSFASVHREALPKRMAEGWGSSAARGARGLSPLGLRLPDGSAYTYVPEADSISIVAGAHAAATLVELDEASWLGLWDATETVFGLVLGQRARVVTGEVGDFACWEPALRALYEKLPPYDPNAPLVGRDGHAIDPTRTFHPDDDPEQMADFLRTAGFILVRQLLPPAEVAGLVEAAETAQAAAREGDDQSWWSTHEDGRRVLGRVLDAGKDPRLRALPADPRLLRIVALSDFDLEPTESAAISVLFKQSGMVFDGKADQPWHRDCGLGGHKHMCPIMNGSLFLKPANRETGELRFLPGSWRTAGCVLDDPDYEMGVGIEASPGDFALHYGDGVHAGTPPTAQSGPFRWSAVFEYGLPARSKEQSQEHYDQIMLEADASDLHVRSEAD
jgi:hypothetical protein